MFTHLILSGGGTNLPALVGALSLFETSDITHISGVSAGAIIGFLFCVLKDVNQMKKILNGIHINEDDIDIFKLIHDFYIYDTDIIIDFLKKQLQIQDITFQELYKTSNIELSIYGTNITNNGQNEVFSMKTTPDMSVFTAIQISIAIPFLFKPIELNGNMYVDGSVTRNYPLEIYDDIDDEYKLCIFSLMEKNIGYPKTFPDYCKSYMSFMLHSQLDKLNLENRSCIKVLIPSLDVPIFSYESQLFDTIFEHGVQNGVKQVKKEYIINNKKNE